MLPEYLKPAGTFRAENLELDQRLSDIGGLGRNGLWGFRASSQGCVVAFLSPLAHSVLTSRLTVFLKIQFAD
jgi:hypothetical protein